MCSSDLTSARRGAPITTRAPSIATERALFKVTTGSTLKTYVESVRLGRIETLLAHSSLPLKTIASRVGLSSANYLSAAFTRRSGMSPRQYRRSRAS